MTKPSLYREEYITRADEYLKTVGREQTELPTVEGFAHTLGVDRDTLYNWAKLNPEFDDKLKKIKEYQKVQLINDGLYGGKEINAAVAIFLMKVNHDMIEKSALDLTSGGDKIAPMVVLDTKKDE